MNKTSKPTYEKVNDNVIRITLTQVNEVPINALYKHKEMIEKRRADAKRQHEAMKQEYDNMKQEFELQDKEFTNAISQLGEAIQEAKKLGLTLVDTNEEKK
jgi:hypothetical protein